MLSLAAVVLPLLAAFAPAGGVPTSSPIIGTINSPTALATLSEGSFPFSYTIDNWCEEGYNTYQVFASQGTSAPTFADLDSNGEVPNAVVSWGPFTIANFGLPPMGTPPPSELTLPSLDDVLTEGSDLFITVVETFRSCPGHVVEELGVTSVPVQYS